MEWKLLTRTCGATRWCGTIWKGKKALNLILANTSSREVLAGTSDVKRQEPGCILKEKNWQPPRTWLEESISCLSDKKLGWVWHRRSKADLVLAAKWPRSLLASFWWGHVVWTRSKDVFAHSQHGDVQCGALHGAGTVWPSTWCELCLLSALEGTIGCINDEYEEAPSRSLANLQLSAGHISEQVLDGEAYILVGGWWCLYCILVQASFDTGFLGQCLLSQELLRPTDIFKLNKHAQWMLSSRIQETSSNSEAKRWACFYIWPARGCVVSVKKNRRCLW